MSTNRFYQLAIFLVLALSSCTKKDLSHSAENKARPVKYAQVGSSNLIGAHSFTGLAKPQKESKLSFRVGGTIEKLYVKIGDRVSKGQLLASLDPTDYAVSYNQSVANVKSSKAQIESAEAQHQSAKANFIASESNYKRYEKLYETNSISLAEFEQAKSSYEGAEANLTAALTQVEAARASSSSTESVAISASNQVSYTRMRAPFNGVVTAVNAEINEIAGQGTPIITISSDKNPDVEVGVSEGAIALINPGMDVKITMHSIDDVVFEGSVYEVGYSSSGNTYPVTIRFKESDLRIRPGMPASATFEFNNDGSKKSVLVVPPGSVGSDETGRFVYVIADNNGTKQVNKTHIEIGNLTNVGFEVVNGLNSGELVASSGLNILRDGMEVRLYENN